MSYFEEIKKGLKVHLDTIISINLENLTQSTRQKIVAHINATRDVDSIVDKEEPQKLKHIIEYLAQEGRNFGWTFSQTPEEIMSEESFLKFKKLMIGLISGMTESEKLHYFGYHKDYENIPPSHKSAKDVIRVKLFFTQ